MDFRNLIQQKTKMLKIVDKNLELKNNDETVSDILNNLF